MVDIKELLGAIVVAVLLCDGAIVGMALSLSLALEDIVGV